MSQAEQLKQLKQLIGDLRSAGKKYNELRREAYARVGFHGRLGEAVKVASTSANELSTLEWLLSKAEEGAFE